MSTKTIVIGIIDWSLYMCDVLLYSVNFSFSSNFFRIHLDDFELILYLNTLHYCCQKV